MRVPIPIIDAGVPMPRDASGYGGGGTNPDDSGTSSFDAGVDGGRRPPRSTGGGCCTVGAGAGRSGHEGAIAFSMIALAFGIARLRRPRS